MSGEKVVIVGKVNSLKVLRKVSIGLFLDGGTLGDILLPKRYITGDFKEGDEIQVFIYLDSEDRFIATTEVPLAVVGECAYLKVIATSRVGAFLDWGLTKDLMVPFREQASPMKVDSSYVVFVYIDAETGRIAASSRYWKFLDNVVPQYNHGQEVVIMIAEKTPMGFKAVVNNLHTGMIYANQVFKPLSVGQKLTAFINKIREDDKVDLLLEAPGFPKAGNLAAGVLDVLKANGGYLAVTDKTSPETIKELFGLSKKSFKMVVGTLYRNRQVVIEENGLRLVKG